MTTAVITSQFDYNCCSRNNISVWLFDQRLTLTEAGTALAHLYFATTKTG